MKYMGFGKKQKGNNTEKVQIIVTNHELKESVTRVTNNYCIKYALPMIDSVVIEVEKGLTESLLTCDCHIKNEMNVEMDTIIHAQMNRAAHIIQLDTARQQQIFGEGVGVAVLDTGVYPHPDLTYGKNRIVAFYDVVNGRRYPYDDNGHGTHA